MESMSFIESIQISIVTMMIVFIALYAISLVLESFKFIIKEKQSGVVVKQQKTSSTPTPVVEKIDIESDINTKIAVMVASMEAQKDLGVDDVRVTRIRKVS